MNPLFKWFGGKRSRIPNMVFPQEYGEYREAFMGGGAVYFHLCPRCAVLNDADPNVVNFYRCIADRDLCKKLCENLEACPIPDRDTYIEIGARCEEYLKTNEVTDDPQQACDFYFTSWYASRGRIYGHLGFNGWTGNKRTFKQLNRKMSIKRFAQAHHLLKTATILHGDFSVVLEYEARDTPVFMFLDPPYYDSRRAYGYNYFDSPDMHNRLAEILKETSHLFLLTYADCPEIRKLYSWAPYVKEVSQRYVSKTSADEEVVELYISNYRQERRG